MSTKPKFPRDAADEVARELCKALKPVCEKLIVAGSLRRRKEQVGDIELLYIPKVELREGEDMFTRVAYNLAEPVIQRLLDARILERRKGINGSALAFGPLNKLLVHCATGMPVDLFATTQDAWWNYLVSRTGPLESNIAVASAAQRKGWKWRPYSVGFTRGAQTHVVDSERAVFEFVGLPYYEPVDRHKLADTKNEPTSLTESFSQARADITPIAP